MLWHRWEAEEGFGPFVEIQHGLGWGTGHENWLVVLKLHLYLDCREASCWLAFGIQAGACRSYVEGSCASEGFDQVSGLVVVNEWLVGVVKFAEHG